MRPELRNGDAKPDDPEDCVVGYVRIEPADPAALGPLCESVRAFCRAKGLILGPVFIDREVSGSEADRIGFTALTDVLALPFVKGVVMPSLDHLSPTMDVRVRLMKLFLRYSTPVHVVEEVELGADGACA
ncbi:recombinase family protein [Lentzea sp. JNUCC 0626]|uniref:recombinase family protein n=1 Tax=Lentzea sp. JNUCC 0626 TaxID=3367513 RepID=UPI00374A5C3D